MTDIAFTAPHFGATEIARKLLCDGASAIDAMIAASAAISVLYPHMNSLGGDGFWLIQYPGEAPIAIDACGTSAAKADIDWYQQQGFDSIPSRGGPAALCLGGTLDGWRVAREISEKRGVKNRELKDLLAPSVQLAKEGVEVTPSLQMASKKVQPELAAFEDYQRVFCPKGDTLKAGEILKNPGLANFLCELADKGTQDFFSGGLAKNLTDWLKFHGSPVRIDDFSGYRARVVTPLHYRLPDADVYNLPAPTQGLASLLILAVYEKLLELREANNEADHVHYLVEATKQAFLVRDREVTDPGKLSESWSKLLLDNHVSALSNMVDPDLAMPWPKTAEPGDTVWMGAMDKTGCMVSFIQSVYWEFGSGLVHPDYGLVWNNRGLSFSLETGHPNQLGPHLKPFHTLNPACAIFDDGRRMVYGTMGGEGQPQTQAALFTRFARQGYSLEQSIARGRWLLGRTWGDQSQDLKMEANLYAEIGDELEKKGHQIVVVPEQNELMGHAGAIVLNPDGSAVAATDPRSDGMAIRDHA